MAAGGSPPGSAGVSPAYGLARWQRTPHRWLGASCKGVAVDGRLLKEIWMRAGARPGARASRPHKAWHDGNEPRKGGLAHLARVWSGMEGC